MKSHRLAVAFAALGLIACGKGKKPEPVTTPPTTPPAADAGKTEAPDAAKVESPDAAKVATPDAAKVESPDAAKVESPDAAKAEAKLIPTTTKSPDALAEFNTGEALMYDARGADGLVHMKKAVELDPDFVQARAVIGSLTPGPDGIAMLEKAAGAAAELPAAERTRVEAMLADRRGDDAKAAELEKKVVELAPDDWRGYVDVGGRARRANDPAGEIAAYAKAAELNPKSGSIHNSLGYAYLLQNKKEEAIAEFKKYTELAPAEPNPHDSLGEALLAAGKLADAEAAFRKALEVEPSFFPAWGGVAECRALGGDWKGAKEASAKALEGAMLPGDRNDAQTQNAWLLAASGDVPGAVAAFTALEEEAAKAGDPASAVFAGINKAMLLMYEGKPDEAGKAAVAAAERNDKAGDASAATAAAKRSLAALQAMLAGHAGKAEDAAKNLAALDELIKAVPGRAFAQSLGHMAHGVVLLPTDAKAAAAELAACIWSDDMCKWAEIAALEKAGDKDGAAAAKQKFVDTPLRSMGYVYIRAKLGTIPEPIK